MELYVKDKYCYEVKTNTSLCSKTFRQTPSDMIEKHCYFSKTNAVRFIREFSGTASVVSKRFTIRTQSYVIEYVPWSSQVKFC